MNDAGSDDKGIGALSWFVGLVAVVLFYVLSIGPTFWLSENTPLLHGAERQIERFYVPLYWCMDHVPGCSHLVEHYLVLWGWEPNFMF